MPASSQMGSRWNRSAINGHAMVLLLLLTKPGNTGECMGSPGQERKEPGPALKYFVGPIARARQGVPLGAVTGTWANQHTTLTLRGHAVVATPRFVRQWRHPQKA